VQIAFGCRYDPVTEGWRRLPGLPTLSAPVLLDPAKAGTAERIVYRLPDEPGLYWLRWSEESTSKRSVRQVRRSDSIVGVGRVLCNDVSLGPAPAGRIAECGPGDREARAVFVPVPTQACMP
jgi:hypothetical protein